MTHEEAIAVKIYYEALQSANENDIELRYNSKDTVEYVEDTKMTKKVYFYLMNEFLYFGKEDSIEEHNTKLHYVNLIAKYLTLLDEVHTDKVGVR